MDMNKRNLRLDFFKFVSIVIGMVLSLYCTVDASSPDQAVPIYDKRAYTELPEKIRNSCEINSINGSSYICSSSSREFEEVVLHEIDTPDKLYGLINSLGPVAFLKDERDFIGFQKKSIEQYNEILHRIRESEENKNYKNVTTYVQKLFSDSSYKNYIINIFCMRLYNNYKLWRIESKIKGKI